MRRMFTEKQVKELAREKVIEVLESGELNVINVDNINADNIGANEISVSGDAKLFENIVDKDGHKRFVENEIEIKTISGVSKVYGKWSLSGSHLMFVLCLSIDNGTSITSSTFAEIELPSWIMDKLFPIRGQILESKNIYFYAQDNSTQGLGIAISKINNKMEIWTYTALAFTAERMGRITFDFLVDNE